MKQTLITYFLYVFFYVYKYVLCGVASLFSCNVGDGRFPKL